MTGREPIPGQVPNQVDRPTNPDALKAPERPVIKANFNEGFKLPKPTLPKEIPIGTASANELTEIAAFDLEIQRGEDMIKGEIVVSADTMYPGDIQEGNSDIQAPRLLEPDGPVDFVFSRRPSKEGHGFNTVAKQTPLVIAIHTKRYFPIHSSSSSNVAHFLRYKDHLYEGTNMNTKGDIETSLDKWDEKASNVNLGDGLIYLPYSEGVFDNLEVFIGDTPPQVEGESVTV